MLRALHSLSGVLPVGLFMLLQLWTHAKALDGAEAHQDAMRSMSGLPSAPLWEALILVPLAFHAIYGVVLAARPRYNVGRYPFSHNWMFTLQRFGGLLALLFITFHMASFWLQTRLGRVDVADLHELMVARLSATSMGVPWMAVGYIVGLGACAFHFATGLWTFCVRWGLTHTRAARSRLGFAVAVFGLGVFLFGARTIIHLATGQRLLGSSPPASPDTTTCGEASPPASATQL